MADGLTIDREFQSLCPPLSEGEFALLRDSIAEDGCREPIVAWNGVIIDGHNRYKICAELKREFAVAPMTFQDREEAKSWILRNQLGRRNLGFLQASYLRGMYYNSVKAPLGGKRTRVEYQNNSAATVGKLFGVSGSTVRGDRHTADAVQRLTATARAVVMSPGFIGRAQHVIDLSVLSPEAQDDIARRLLGGTIKNLSSAIRALRIPGTKDGQVLVCKGCGVRLARGVPTCLKCDLSTDEVRQRLEAAERKERVSVGEPADGWEQRLEAIRKAKQSGDEIGFHVAWLVERLNPNEVGNCEALRERLRKLSGIISGVLQEAVA